MTIKIKLRGDKAIIRFNNKYEEQYFVNNMLKLRDSDPKTHPKISVKGRDARELPPLRPPKPPMVKPGINPQVVPTGAPIKIKGKSNVEAKK